MVMVCARCWHGSHRGCDDARNAGDGDPPQSTRSSSFCQRKFRIQKRCHQFWRVEAVVDKNISDVPSAKKDDRMAIFANLFIGLARDHRGGHQNPELPVANSGDQTRNLSNSNSIRRSFVEPRLITFRFERKFRVDRIVRKAEEIATDCVATSIDAASCAITGASNTVKIAR